MRALLLLLWVGGGYPEDEFRDALDAESCQWQADCYDYESADTCIAAARESRTPVSDDCTYDPHAARECIDDYRLVDCPDGDEYIATVPEACTLVWDCPG